MPVNDVFGRQRGQNCPFGVNFLQAGQVGDLIKTIFDRHPSQSQVSGLPQEMHCRGKNISKKSF